MKKKMEKGTIKNELSARIAVYDDTVNFADMTADERKAFLEKVENDARARWQREQEKGHGKKLHQAEEKISRGVRPTIEEFYLLYGVKISQDMSGKMDGINSLSTCCLPNKLCADRLLNGVGICKYCFSAASMWKRSVLENTVLNFAILTTEVIPSECWPDPGTLRFRFESFGDIFNAVQCINYLNYINAFPGVRFAWWTKNPHILNGVFRSGYEKPLNCTFVYSSQFLNEADDSMIINTVLKMYPWLDKIFTVYSLDWLTENGYDEKGIHDFINCGGRSCVGCDNCYLNANCTSKFIHELEKSDARKIAVNW